MSSALKPLTESNQNCLNNNLKSHHEDKFNKHQKPDIASVNNNNTNTNNDTNNQGGQTTILASTTSPIKPVFKNPLLLRTPKVSSTNNSHFFNFANGNNNKTSDSTIQLDLTQVGKSPITSTPLVNNFNSDTENTPNPRLNDNSNNDSTQSEKTTDSGFNSNNFSSVTTIGYQQLNTSFVEKDELMDKVGKLIALSKKRLDANEQKSDNVKKISSESAGKSFYDDSSNLLSELEDIEKKDASLSDTTIIKLLTDSLVKIKNNLNYYKLEAKLVVQNNEDIYSRNEVESRLMQKELERLKYDYNLDRHIHEDEKTKLQKYEQLKEIAKSSLDNFEKLNMKNREISKKALKYKIKYNKSKEMLAKKEAEIKSLKKTLKSPPRFRIIQQQQQQEKRQASKSSANSSFVGEQTAGSNITNYADDTTASPDQTIITSSPTNNGKGVNRNGSNNNSNNNNSNNNNSSGQSVLSHSTQSLSSTNVTSSLSARTLGNGGSNNRFVNDKNDNNNNTAGASQPQNRSQSSNSLRSYDTLNMLAFQALLASTSYERTQKARKSNSEASIPTSTDGNDSSFASRKLPGLIHSPAQNTYPRGNAEMGKISTMSANSTATTSRSSANAAVSAPATTSMPIATPRTGTSTTKLPSINHLLSKPLSFSGPLTSPSPSRLQSQPATSANSNGAKVAIDYRSLNQNESDRESSNLNSNDTIDEEQTY